MNIYSFVIYLQDNIDISNFISMKNEIHLLSNKDPIVVVDVTENDMKLDYIGRGHLAA